MRQFNPSCKNPARAVQAWQILVGSAMNRQMLTYQILARRMYNKDAAGVLDKILGHIAFYCIDEKLPPLTSIVVGKGRGKPGRDIPMDLSHSDRERERVYARDWYDIWPPTDEELHAAYLRHMKRDDRDAQ